LASKTNEEQNLKDDSLKELKRDFDRRIDELRAEVREGRRSGGEESLDLLKDDLERMLSDLRHQLDESVEPGREAVREKPFVALGIALGVGVLLGIFLGRKSKG
jgi:ElaB/YqjD/DUF883 family membrane-anchored ribosome-binding protein